MENIISYISILGTKAEGLFTEAHAIFANYYMWFGSMQASIGLLMIGVALCTSYYAYLTNLEYEAREANKPTGQNYRERDEFNYQQNGLATKGGIAAVIAAFGFIGGSLLIACGALHMLAADYYALHDLLRFAR